VAPIIIITAAVTIISVSPDFKHSRWRRHRAIEQRPKIGTRKQTWSAGNSRISYVWLQYRI
jgi:hypothetical protein